MKRILFFFGCVALAALLWFPTQAQTNPSPTPPQEVPIYLRNNSLRFRSLALVVYYPESSQADSWYWSQGAVYLPFTSKKLTVGVGTRIYGVPQNELDDFVKDEGRLPDRKPLLEVTAADAGKTFDLE